MQVCALTSRELEIPYTLSDGIGKPISNSNTKVGLSYDEMFNDDFAFDMDSHDVMVFLHMQKTGKQIVFLSNNIDGSKTNLF